MKLINKQYLDKFQWNGPLTVKTVYGTRLKWWVRVGNYERDIYTEHKRKFDSLMVTLSQGKDDKGQLVAELWYFIKWEIPKREAAVHQERSVELSQRSESSMEIPAPPGLEYYPYQKAAIEYALLRKGTLIGDSMGLGKTCEAIGYINAYNARAGKRSIQRILLICPADIRLYWRDQLSRWLVHDYSIGIAQSGVFPSTDIVIISYEGVIRFEKEVTFYWCLVVIDEADYISNPKAKSTKAICGYIPSRAEAAKGMKMQASLPAKLKIAMTGTPIRNRPKNIFSIINYLAPHLWPDRNRFVARYCGGRQSDGSWTSDGCSNEQELYVELRKTVMIRREKHQCLGDLPALTRSVCVLPVDEKYNRQLGQLTASHEMRSWMAKVCDAKSTLEISKCISPMAHGVALDGLEKAMDSGMSATFELFHLIGLAKVEAALEIIRRATNETPKVVIFAHHKDVIDRLVAGLPGCLRIDGSVSHEYRHSVVELFQTDPSSGPLVVQIDCAKGITLTAASLEFFVEGSWLPGKILQAEARCHRIGTKSAVSVVHLVLSGSIDLTRANSVIQKQQDIDRILDVGDRQHLEREPVIPMPWVTLTPTFIAERSVKIAHQVEEIRRRCEEYLRTGKPSDANRTMLRKMEVVTWTPKLAVLGEAILESASQILDHKPEPSTSLTAPAPPVRCSTNTQAELQFQR